MVREECGSLPIPLGGDIGAFWRDDVVRLGMRAGLFHPTTGYSLPDDLLSEARRRGDVDRLELMLVRISLATQDEQRAAELERVIGEEI